MALTPTTVRMGNQQKVISNELCAQLGMRAITTSHICVKAAIRTKRIPFSIKGKGRI